MFIHIFILRVGIVVVRPCATIHVVNIHRTLHAVLMVGRSYSVGQVRETYATCRTKGLLMSERGTCTHTSRYHSFLSNLKGMRLPVVFFSM